MSTMSHVSAPASGLTKDEKFVILASSLGTMFEWYDFFIYAVLTPFFAGLFFPPGNPTWALLGALGAYAAGFIVRPFGAVFFGRLGDLIGRKTTFLVTITIMGLATFCIGLLPGYASIGALAPILLLIIRLLQGLAIGGEYGGAATYVAEHSQNGRRGYTTSWIQTTATLGLLLALVIVYAMRSYDPVWFSGGSGSFAGWRVPFVGSILLLAMSLYIRLKLNESPVFEKMKSEGRGSSTPFRDSFFKFPNNKIVLVSFLAAVMAQAVIWYTAQFYALFFISGPLKANWDATYWIIGWAILFATPFFVIFGALSDRIGRKPIVIAGSLLAAILIFPLFHMLSGAVNPALDKFNADNGSKIIVTADPAQCHFTVIPIPTVTPSGDCDRAKSILTSNGVQFVSKDGAAGSKVTLDAAGNVVEGENPFAWNAALAKAGYPNMALAESDVPLTKDQTDAVVKAQADKKAADVAKLIGDARKGAVAPISTIAAPTVGADGSSTVHVAEVKTSLAKAADINYPKAMFAIFAIMVLATMTYGPLAAWLVELFPSNIRYTSMSLPYHMGNGVVGGLLPLTATAWVAYSGNVYQGLWYPVIFCAIGGIVGLLFLGETKGVDIAKT